MKGLRFYEICKKTYFILFAAMALFSFICIINVRRDNPEKQDYSTNWVTDTNEEVELGKLKESIKVYKEIKEEDIHKTIYIHSKSLLIDVYLDDKLVDKTEEKDINFFGKTPGPHFIYYDIKDEDVGKKIALDICVPYESSSGKILEMVIGNGLDIQSFQISSRFLGSCISFTIICLGLFVIGISLPLRKAKYVGGETFYLGLFSVTVGVFMLCDINALQLLFGGEYEYHTIDEVWLMLVVPSLVLYFNSIFKIKIKYVSNVILTLSLVITLFSYITNFFGLFDFHEILYLTHITYVIGGMTVLISIIKKSKNIHKGHIVAMVSLLICSFIDLVNYYAKVNIDSSTFTRIGILTFLFIEIFTILIEYFRKIKLDTKRELLSKLAYQDGLTNLFNRTSYMEKIDELVNNKNASHVIMLDVNNLKTVNDTYGHNEGDELIIEASNKISEVFNDIGTVYRIGGDEFAVLINENIKESEIKKRHKDMIKNIKNYNEFSNKPYKLAIALGYCIYNDEIDYKEMISIADSNMYENKRKMKRKTVK